MRRSIAVIALLLTVSLLSPGCGGADRKAEVKRLLESRIGGIEAISYTCVTEDGEHTYREEVSLRFPDAYNYRLYDCSEGEPRLLTVAAQAGNEAFRASAASDESGGGLQVQRTSGLPPLRGTGVYLSIYHLLGNGDYFQSIISLLDAGALVVEGREEYEGRDAWLLQTAAGLRPDIRLWLDPENGLPLRKELVLNAERTLVFRFEEVREDPGLSLESFPPDISSFASPTGSVQESSLDGGCRPLRMDEAQAALGFAPLLPKLEGFELAQSLVRDPRDSNLGGEGQTLQFPEGFRELYLVLRSGPRQVEILQSPYDPEFGYYASGLGALTGAYLSQQETWGPETGNALYSAALDCQELHLVAGDLEIMVTGDLTRKELETLAVNLQDLAAAGN